MERARNALPENTKPRPVVKFARTVPQEHTTLLWVRFVLGSVVPVMQILKVHVALDVPQKQTVFATRVFFWIPRMEGVIGVMAENTRTLSATRPALTAQDHHIRS